MRPLLVIIAAQTAAMIVIASILARGVRRPRPPETGSRPAATPRRWSRIVVALVPAIFLSVGLAAAPGPATATTTTIPAGRPHSTVLAHTSAGGLPHTPKARGKGHGKGHRAEQRKARLTKAKAERAAVQRSLARLRRLYKELKAENRELAAAVRRLCDRLARQEARLARQEARLARLERRLRHKHGHKVTPPDARPKPPGKLCPVLHLPCRPGPVKPPPPPKPEPPVCPRHKPPAGDHDCDCHKPRPRHPKDEVNEPEPPGQVVTPPQDEDLPIDDTKPRKHKDNANNGMPAPPEDTLPERGTSVKSFA